MNNSYITIIKEKRTALSRKRIPLNQNGCTANFRIGVPFEQNLQKKNRNEKEKVKLLQSEVKKLKKEKQIDYKSNYDSEKYSKSVRNVLSYIEENYHQDISLESAATEVFMNKNYLSSLFCNEMGVGFTKYLSDFRLKKAKILLRETELNINEIANMTGFATANYFVRVFKKQENCTPKEYRIMEERKLK